MATYKSAPRNRGHVTNNQRRWGYMASVQTATHKFGNVCADDIRNDPFATPYEQFMASHEPKLPDDFIIGDYAPAAVRH